jgi:small subunit ribosomal protein S9
MKIIQTSGKRKKAIARAVLKAGNGKVTINNLDLNEYEPAFARMKILEPLILAKDAAEKADISVNVEGGGVTGRTEACRLAIAKALAEFSPKMKERFLKYDRHLLIADVRQREARKPNTHGNARGKVQKSYR